MALISTILPGVQLVLSLLLVGAIILQQRGAGLGGAFGDQGTESFYTRRGPELFLFQATMVLAALFVASAVLALVLK